MSYYILDTDHLSLQQRGHSLLNARLSSLPDSDISVTIVSIEEVIRGRLSQIRESKTELKFIEAYRRFEKDFRWLNQFQILDYSQQASQEFEQLRAQKIRIGSQDLRIASITLSVNGILLTRNAVDFGKVHGLTIQDWTV